MHYTNTAVSIFPLLVILILLLTLSLLFFYRFVFFVFFICVVACSCVLLSVGLYIWPMIWILIYLGVIGVIIVSSFIVAGRDLTDRSAHVVDSPSYSLLFFLVGLVFVILPFNSIGGFWPYGYFDTYSTRAEQILLQKYTFFSPDILSFFIMFDGFFWSILLVGVFLLIAALLTASITGE